MADVGGVDELGGGLVEVGDPGQSSRSSGMRPGGGRCGMAAARSQLDEEAREDAGSGRRG